MNSKLKEFLSNVRTIGLRYYRHIGSLLLAALLGVVVAQAGFSSVPELPDIENVWALPNAKDLSLASDIETILAEPLFGGEPVVIEAPKVAATDGPILEDWRLLGIITEGLNRQIIILNLASGKVESAQTDDILPGGETLVSISDNAIEIRNGEQRNSIALFQGNEGIEE